VAGGTGAVGRHVVVAARAAGHDTVVLSRSTGVDLLTGEGLSGRLAGVDTVIDVTSGGGLSTKGAVSFFAATTRRLLEAERAAGVAHHVALSIIGATRAPSGHYAGKTVQEKLVTASGETWTILRTTQFHEFARQTASRAAVAGVVVAPAMRSQPIAAVEVAAELLSLAEGSPAGVAPDLAGPGEEDMADLVRRYLAATGRRGRVLRVPLPGVMGRAMRDGTLLPSPGTRLASTTFDEWLAGEAAQG